jgi:hypothetical protein
MMKVFADPDLADAPLYRLEVYANVSWSELGPQNYRDFDSAKDMGRVPGWLHAQVRRHPEYFFVDLDTGRARTWSALHIRLPGTAAAY